MLLYHAIIFCFVYMFFSIVSCFHSLTIFFSHIFFWNQFIKCILHFSSPSPQHLYLALYFCLFFHSLSTLIIPPGYCTSLSRSKTVQQGRRNKSERTSIKLLLYFLICNHTELNSTLSSF